METTKPSPQPPPRSADGAGRRERSFDLSLPVLVKGFDAAGRRFEEHTELRAISSEEASFKMKAPLTVGSRLTVVLDVPRTLILENPLRLLVTGAVVHVVSAEGNCKPQVVSIRLDRSFRLHAANPSAS